MRAFYEFWSPFLNRQPTSADMESGSSVSIVPIRQLAAADLDIEAFLSVGFSSHIEIMAKAKCIEECMYYIRAAQAGRWTKMQLRERLKADDYHHIGGLPNNFVATIDNPNRALAAVRMFKDEYLLDFINVEDIEATFGEDVDERVVEKSIVSNIRNFIMTFGRDFSFVGNQFRMEVAGHEQFIIESRMKIPR